MAIPPYLPQNQVYYASPWKYSIVSTTSGTSLFGMIPINNTDSYPAIVIKSHPKAKAVLAPFSFGEAYMSISDHYSMMRAVLTGSNAIGLSTRVNLAGPGEVSPFFYETNDNRGVLMLMNWNDFHVVNITVEIDFLKGRSVRDLRDSGALITGKSDGKLNVSLVQNEAKLYIIGEAVKPSVGIDVVSTPSEIIPSGKPVPVVVNYDTVGWGQCDIVVELRQRDSSRIFASASTNVNGKGCTTLHMFVEDYSRFDNTYMATSDGKRYYYRAVIRQWSDYSEARLSVDVEFLKPSTYLQLEFNSSSTVSTVVSWNYLPSFLSSAFRGLIAIFMSTKTASIDSKYVGKVQSVANTLLALGYQQSLDLSPYDYMNSDKGPFFWIARDDTLTVDGTRSTSLDFLRRRVKVLILPGVTVLSDEEVSNITQWVQSDDMNNVLVTTEGHVGRLNSPSSTNMKDPLASIFGMTPEATETLSIVLGNVINIVNTSSPIVEKVGTIISVPGGLPGDGWKSTDKGYALGIFESAPVLITNRCGGGRTFAFNFDVTQLDSDPYILNLWYGVNDYIQLDPELYKLRWELRCGPNLVNYIDMWVNNTWSDKYVEGSTKVIFNPSSTCSNAVYKGYLYPYYGDYVKDAIGYYTSDNDTSNAFKTSANFVQFLWVMAIVLCTITLFNSF